MLCPLTRVALISSIYVVTCRLMEDVRLNSMPKPQATDAEASAPLVHDTRSTLEGADKHHHPRGDHYVLKQRARISVLYVLLTSAISGRARLSPKSIVS